jgi:hypothetical protein
MYPIIALWCHPRSMSTVMERVMRERGDCACFHEPFLHHYYNDRAARQLPHYDIDPGTPTSYAEIRDMLLGAAEERTVFLKDMSYYIVPTLFDDPDFAGRITHSFLIRDPVSAILSYHKLDPDLTREEIGLEAQWRHVSWLIETTGETPVVVEAERVQRDAQGIIGAYWRRVGLAPVADAFEWSSDEVPDDWQYVAGWHESVSESGAIRDYSAEDAAARRTEFEVAAAKAPQLNDFLAHHQPYYEKLRGLALRRD